MRIRLPLGVLAALGMLLLLLPVAPGPAQPPETGPDVKPQTSKDLGDVPHTKVTVDFVKIGDATLRMGIYRPKDFKGKLPLVVWICGGAWRNLWTNDSQCLPGGNGVGLLVKNGYAVASISHRLARGYNGSTAWVFPAQIHDCKGAIRFLRANADKYALDVDRIGVWGGSSGGHLAALLGTSGGVEAVEGNVGGNLEFSSQVQAIVDCSGPTDLARLEETCHQFYGPAQSPPATLVGGQTKDHMDLVKMANPVTYIKKDCPPFLVFHGDKDTLVPPEQSQFLVDALKKAGIDVTMEFVKGMGHGGSTAAQDEHLNLKVLEFFDKHIKTPTSQPAHKP